jgi:hypothetical protein
MVGNEDRPSVVPPVADGDVYPFADVQAVAASRLALATSASANLISLTLQMSRLVLSQRSAKSAARCYCRDKTFEGRERSLPAQLVCRRGKNEQRLKLSGKRIAI